MSEVSRSDFVKIAAITLLGAGTAQVSRRLGVSPRSAEERFSFSHAEPRFRIGWHLLKEGDLNPNTALLSGEMDIRSIFAYYGQPSPSYIHEDYQPKARIKALHPSTRGSKEDINKHIKVLQTAQEQNVPVIACDGRHFESVGYLKFFDALELGNERILLTLFGALGLGLAEAGKMAYQLQTSGHLSKNDPLLRLVEAVDKGYEGAVDKIPPLPRLIKYGIAYWLGEKLGDLQNTAGNALNNLYDAEKFLVSLTDADLTRLSDSTEIRNLAMALNFHKGLQLLDNLPFSKQLKEKFSREGQSPDVFFFAGTGHVRAKEYYQYGATFCEDKLLQHANKIIHSFRQELTQILKARPADLETTLKDWVLSTSAFSFPLASYMNSPDYLTTVTASRSYSPRALLWKVLSAAQKEHPDDPALKQMISSLVKEEAAYMKLLDKVIPAIHQKALDKRMSEENLAVVDDQNSYEVRIVDGIPVIFTIPQDKQNK